jgi:hypothetical protein
MKEKMFKLIITMALILSTSLMAQGQQEQGVDFEKTGQSTMTFLQVGLVPEGVALGEAYSAIGTGVRAMYYNPAGLAEMSTQFEVFVSNLEWIADIKYISGGAAWNSGNYGVIGVNFLTVDYGDINGTQLIGSADAGSHPIGYIDTGPVDNVGAYAIGLMYSKKISNLFTFGAGMRYAVHQLGQMELNGATKNNEMSKLVFDMGVKYYLPIESLRMGMSFRNFSTSVRYEEVSTQLPFTFAVGVAMDLVTAILPDLKEDHSLLTTFEFSHPNNYTERLHMGVEYTLMKALALRAGYMTNHDVNGLSLGVGLNANIKDTSTQISYTYSSTEIFDDVNRFSLMFAF